MPQFSIRSMFIAVSLMCVLALIVGIATRQSPQRSFVDSLGAVEVYELGPTLPPIHLLKAKISPQDFDRFVRRFKLSEFESNGQLPEWTSINYGWWDPISDAPPTHGVTPGNPVVLTVAKYENGYLYYQSFE